MDEARDFATKYLREALEKSEIFTAWNKKQNVSQEIQYELENSWHASVSRVEAKRYCQGYSSDYARLAKSVYNWFKHSEFPLLPFGRVRPLECFFIVAAGTYEPQYAKCRFLFSKLACLNTVLDDMYDTYGTLDELKLFTEVVKRWDL